MPTSNICTEGLKYFDWIFLLKRFYSLEWNGILRNQWSLCNSEDISILGNTRIKNTISINSKFQEIWNWTFQIANKKVQNFYTEEKIPLYSWHSHFLVKQMDLFEFKIVFFLHSKLVYWFSFYLFLLFGIDLYIK